MRTSARICGTVAVVLLVGGCGSGASTRPSGPATGTVVLTAVCPLVHTSYDALVASAPASQQTFATELARIWDEADADTRAALSPVRNAAQDLVAAGRGDGFAAARDGVYTAIRGLSEQCAEQGRPILHAGH